MEQLPAYDELPPAPEGGRSGWHLFGSDDNVGLLNLLTPQRVVQAAGLIRKGSVFPLDAPIDAFSPPQFGRRGDPRHQVLQIPLGFDDVYDNFFPQGSSQWDALGHVSYSEGVFYNGATETEIATGRRNTIEHWAKRGIVGRAVLLDMVASFAKSDRAYDPSASVAFSVEDLERARQDCGVEFHTGDILLLHTGFAAWYLDQTPARRTSFTKALAAPGIAPGEEMCRYLWDAHVVAVASDAPVVEVFPVENTGPTNFLHRMLIGQFGMALGELWWTEDLAADCAADGVYEMFLSSAPLHAPGAVGSPSSALAIK